MKTTIALVLSTFFSFVSFTIYAQEDWEWEFMPKLYAERAMLETATTLWVNNATAILEIDLETEEVNIHPLPTMFANASTTYLDGYSSLRGLWIDSNNRVGAFLSSGEGFVRQEGDSWVFVPFEFAPFYYPQEIVGQENAGHLLVRNADKIYRWHPDYPQVRFEELEGVLIAGNRFLLDDNYTLWAYTHNGGTLSAQSGAGVNTFVVPGEPQDLVRTHVTQGGEIWACRTDGFYYKAPGEEWLALPFSLNFADNEQGHFVTSAPGTAYFFANLQIYRLQVETDGNISMQLLNELEPNCCDSFQPLAVAQSGDLYFTHASLARVMRISEDNQVSTLPSPPFLTRSSIGLTPDPIGRIWSTGALNNMVFSKGQWEPVQRVFPNFPNSVYDLAFRTPFIPVILHYGDEGYQLQQLVNGQWQHLENELPEGVAIGYDTKIIVDPLNRIWHHTLNDFGRWEYQRWWSDLLSDYFPRTSSTLNKLQIDQQQRIYLTGDAQLIVRDGGYYESYGLEELGFDLIDNGRNYLSSDLHDDGHIYLANRFEIIKWKDGLGQQLPAFDLLTTDNLFDSGIRKIFAFADDDIWVSVHHRLSDRMAHFDGEKWSYLPNYHFQWWEENYFELTKDQQGNVWINTLNGIYIISTTGKTLPDTSPTTATDNQLGVFPNPGCCAFQLVWEQETAGTVSIELFDLNGIRRKVIEGIYYTAGQQSHFFTTENYPPGTYIVRLTSNGRSISSKVIVI